MHPPKCEIFCLWGLNYFVNLVNIPLVHSKTSIYYPNVVGCLTRRRIPTSRKLCLTIWFSRWLARFSNYFNSQTVVFRTSLLHPESEILFHLEKVGSKQEYLSNNILSSIGHTAPPIQTGEFKLKWKIQTCVLLSEDDHSRDFVVVILTIQAIFSGGEYWQPKT